MTLENLQSTLQRIADIRSQFEPASSTLDAKAASQFEGVFSKAVNQAENQNNTTTPENLDALIQDQAQAQGVDANLLKAVIRNESNFNPKAVSHVGAQGLMQLMPATAAALNVQDSFNPAQNIQGGAKYLKGLLQKYHQSVPMALAAYNAGPGAVDQHNGIPPFPETKHYVNKVIQSYQAYQNAERS